jgi:ketosteroid isomerase-like protein
MSRHNVELLRRAIDAYNARDLDAVIACCDPSIEFHSMVGAGGGVYSGHEGMRRWHLDLEDAWGIDIRIEPEAYFDLGDRSLLFHVLRGRGRNSGARVAMPNAAAASWREGLIVRLETYIHREDALSDLGVSEDELEPINP